MVNIDELARVAKKYGLAISVAGAADSATGTPDINNMLSVARADFIVAELLKRGIPAKRIHTVSNGGIADYTPIEANQHTRVELRSLSKGITRNNGSIDHNIAYESLPVKVGSLFLLYPSMQFRIFHLVAPLSATFFFAKEQRTDGRQGTLL